MTQRTPLHATHVAAGARMVDFAGWDMPIHYGSQLEEHHQVRRDARVGEADEPEARLEAELDGDLARQVGDDGRLAAVVLAGVAVARVHHHPPRAARGLQHGGGLYPRPRMPVSRR